MFHLPMQILVLGNSKSQQEILSNWNAALTKSSGDEPTSKVSRAPGRLARAFDYREIQEMQETNSPAVK
jgi:hypothetical protein